jgi:hypothetical protein
VTVMTATHKTKKIAAGKKFKETKSSVLRVHMRGLRQRHRIVCQASAPKDLLVEGSSTSGSGQT